MTDRPNYDAIIIVESGVVPSGTDKLVEEVADHQLYLRGDGGLPLPSHVHTRINQYLHLFEVNRNRSPMRFRLR